jgi:hypothetical protein
MDSISKGAQILSRLTTASVVTYIKIGVPFLTTLIWDNTAQNNGVPTPESGCPDISRDFPRSLQTDANTAQ